MTNTILPQLNIIKANRDNRHEEFLKILSAIELDGQRSLGTDRMQRYFRGKLAHNSTFHSPLETLRLWFCSSASALKWTNIIPNPIDRHEINERYQNFPFCWLLQRWHQLQSSIPCSNWNFLFQSIYDRLELKKTPMTQLGTWSQSMIETGCYSEIIANNIVIPAWNSNQAMIYLQVWFRNAPGDCILPIALFQHPNSEDLLTLYFDPPHPGWSHNSLASEESSEYILTDEIAVVWNNQTLTIPVHGWFSSPESLTAEDVKSYQGATVYWLFIEPQSHEKRENYQRSLTFLNQFALAGIKAKIIFCTATPFSTSGFEITIPHGTFFRQIISVERFVQLAERNCCNIPSRLRANRLGKILLERNGKLNHCLIENLMAPGDFVVVHEHSSIKSHFFLTLLWKNLASHNTFNCPFYPKTKSQLKIVAFVSPGEENRIEIRQCHSCVLYTMRPQESQALNILKEIIREENPNIIIWDTSLFFESNNTALMKECLAYCRQEQIGVFMVFSQDQNAEDQIPKWLHGQKTRTINLLKLPSSSEIVWEDQQTTTRFKIETRNDQPIYANVSDQELITIPDREI